MDQPEFLRREKAAERLREHHGLSTTVNSLAKMAVLGTGPRFRLNGRWPVYTIADVDAWARERLSPPGHSTAEVGSQQRQRATA